MAQTKVQLVSNIVGNVSGGGGGGSGSGYINPTYVTG